MSIFDQLNFGNGGAVPPAPQQPMGPQTFRFDALPESLDEMKALPEAGLKTPFEAAALTVCALCAYAAVPQIGLEMLNFLKGPQPFTTMQEQFLRDRFMDGRHIPFSYFEGAVPSNNYTPDRPFMVIVKTSPHSFNAEGYATLFIHSGGADTDRFLKLRRKGDQWFLWEQFLMVGIRKPAAQDPWA